MDTNMGLLEGGTASVVPAAFAFAPQPQVQSLYCPLRVSHALAMHWSAIDVTRFFRQFAHSFLCGQFVHDNFGWSRIGLQGFAHVFERRTIGIRINGYGAVCRHYHIEVAHIGIGGSEEDTVVPCDTGQDDSLDVEMAE
jgi:hypothetical protein